MFYRNVRIPSFLTPNLIQKLISELENHRETYLCVAVNHNCGIAAEESFARFLWELKIDTGGDGFSEFHRYSFDSCAPEWLILMGRSPRERRINFLKDIQNETLSQCSNP